MGNLDEFTLRLLSTLGKYPKGSVRQLSRKLNVSTAILKERIRKLYEDKVLYGVSATINPYSVGLKIVAAFVQTSPSKLKLFERVCDLHPYTHYRVRCFGPINGIFSIFTVPSEKEYMIVELLQKLESEGIVEGSRVEIPVATSVGGETDFSLYDPEHSWRINWSEWSKKIEEAEPLKFKTPKNMLSALKESDMRILHELSKDIRRKRSLIASAAGVRPYHLSRRWKFMETAGVIQTYRVLVGMQLLQITSHSILKCRCSMEETRKVANAIIKLPFQTSLIPLEEGFILYITTTSSDFPKLVEALSKHVTIEETYWCDYGSSLRYYFYNEAFQNGKWRDDEDYMVNSIIEKLKEEA